MKLGEKPQKYVVWSKGIRNMEWGLEKLMVAFEAAHFESSYACTVCGYCIQKTGVESKARYGWIDFVIS